MRALPAALTALTLLFPAGPAEAESIRIVAFGDSNTAGFGVGVRNAYPAQLERALRARGHDVEVLNRGVSGDTTRRALRRFDSAIPEGTDIAILFLGRNDLRFGIPRDAMHDNVASIVRRLRERGIEVILAGFHTVDYSDIAAAYGATYYPDFFDGVAVDGVKKPGYTLIWDIIGHLNAAGYQEIVARLAPLVEVKVVKVLCRRLGEAIIFAPECETFDAWAGITDPVTRR